jgi:hypothetical protein
MRLSPMVVATVAVLALIVGSTFGAPLRNVGKPAVQPDPSWTGPPIDPQAKRGQWFVAPIAGGMEQTFRTYEFYDNVLEDDAGNTHGGGSADSKAILGRISAIDYDPSPTANLITGFTIRATITNDLPGRGQGADGTNSHWEYWQREEKQQKAPMLGTKLTAEFAIDPNRPLPDPWTDPYVEPGAIQVEAVNHDQLAWYCWSPDNPMDEFVPYGDYSVPTWDFGNILPGDSATRSMQFKVSPPIPPDSWYYGALQELQETGQDVLMNRTTSLKISNWVDNLGVDDGTPYPGSLVNPDVPPPLLSSDVSVFCNVPEPGTIAMLAGAGVMGVVALLRRRRKG